jgi:hypothetical protein
LLTADDLHCLGCKVGLPVRPQVHLTRRILACTQGRNSNSSSSSNS